MRSLASTSAFSAAYIVFRQHVAIAAILGAAGMMIAPLSLHAQQPASPASAPAPAAASSPHRPPTGNALARLGETAAWQINVSYATDELTGPRAGTGEAAQLPQPPPPPPPPLSANPLPTSPLRRITVTRTQAGWMSASTDINGQTFRAWAKGRDMLVEAADGTPPFVPGEYDRLAVLDFSRIDFPGLEWLTPAAYAGAETVDGVPCHVYRKGNVAAWIRQDNRLPLRWTKGGETRSLQVLPKPAGLVFPPAVEKVFAALQIDRKWATQPIPAGG